MCHHISKHQEEGRKYDAYSSVFDELQGDWKSEETLSPVFDRSSQSN